MTEAEPQFGASEPGVSYRDRPAAFGVIERAGYIACVFITRPEGAYYDLPGGAVDGGETDAQTLVREFGEETGLIVTPGRSLGCARQFMRMVSGEAVNNLCAFFEGRVQGENGALKIEDDHRLEWLAPLELIANLRHDAHAWAVTAWLRQAPA